MSRPVHVDLRRLQIRVPQHGWMRLFFIDPRGLCGLNARKRNIGGTIVSPLLFQYSLTRWPTTSMFIVCEHYL